MGAPADAPKEKADEDCSADPNILPLLAFPKMLVPDGVEADPAPKRLLGVFGCDPNGVPPAAPNGCGCPNMPPAEAWEAPKTLLDCDGADDPNMLVGCVVEPKIPPADG